MSYDSMFIVSTPFQLMCAYEASQYFNRKASLLIVIYGKDTQTNNEQLDYLVKLLDWENIVFVNDEQTSSKFLASVKKLKSIKGQSFEYVFMGNYSFLDCLFAANVHTEQVFLLDDGTATLIYHQKIMKQEVDTTSWKDKLKKYRYKFFGLKIKLKHEIKFFSCIPVERIANETIIYHEFSFLKEKFDIISDEPTDQNIYYLGTPREIETILVSQKRYLSFSEYTDLQGKIYYVPHRFQSSAILFSYLEEQGVEILKNDMPIELFLLMKKIYPFCVVSTISTALITLKKIFPKTKCVALRPNELYQERDHDHLANIYQTFSDQGVCIAENI